MERKKKKRGMGGWLKDVFSIRKSHPKSPKAEEKADFVDVPNEPPIHGRWVLREKIGSGSFGHIYKAVDNKGEFGDVAVKVERRDAKRRSLLMDVKIVHKMTLSKHFTRFHDSGKTPVYQFLVMELVGPNLSDLRKAAPGAKKRLSLSTGLRLSLQAVEAIEMLHKACFVHRDVKPSNLAMGLGDKTRVLYLIDFGLSARISANSEDVMAGHRGGFKGTVKYASLSAHRGLPLGRVDDLWMIWYSLVELLAGELPWRFTLDRKEVGRMKERFNARPESLLHLTWPRVLTSVPKLLNGTPAHALPDYTAVQQHLADAVHAVGATDADPFDWDNDYADLKKETLTPPIKTTSANQRPSNSAASGTPAFTRSDTRN